MKPPLPEPLLPAAACPAITAAAAAPRRPPAGRRPPTAPAPAVEPRPHLLPALLPAAWLSPSAAVLVASFLLCSLHYLARGYGRFRRRSAPGKSVLRCGERLVSSPCAEGEPVAAEGTEGPGSAGTRRGRRVAVGPCEEMEVPPVSRCPRCGAPGAAPGPCWALVRAASGGRRVSGGDENSFLTPSSSQSCQAFRTLVKGTCFRMSLLALPGRIAYFK